MSLTHYRSRGRTSPHRTGFTLVELLVVIAIIGVLVGLLLPAVQAAREAARRSQCSNNLRQMGLGFQNYHASQNHFAAGWLEDNNPTRSARKSNFLWSAVILPYVEQAPLHSQLDFDQQSTAGTPGGAVDNLDLIGTELPGYRCPSDQIEANSSTIAENAGFTPAIPMLAVSNYVGSGTTCLVCYFGQLPDKSDGSFIDVVGACRQLPLLAPLAQVTRQNGVMYRNSETPIRQITDGTSNTFLIGERIFGDIVDPGTGTTFFSQAFWATLPAPSSNQQACYAGLAIAATRFENALKAPMINGHPYGFSSRHAGGVQVALCDGSARFIQEAIDEYTVEYLVRTSDENPLGEF